jgi:hypothetical protein
MASDEGEAFVFEVSLLEAPMLFGQDLFRWKRADPDMTMGVSMAYNTRDGTMREQAVR